MDATLDDNNNASGEKSYSLRPRSSVKRDREDHEDEEAWKPRGRTRKRQKQKSAPLSKYRRKTANARERSRMREINDAFEALRRAIPQLASCDASSEKISKIMTLRLAMKYITALSGALDDPESYTLDFQSSLSLMDSCSTTSSTSDVTWSDQLFASQTSPSLRSILDSATTPLTVDTQDSFSNFFAKNSLSSFEPVPALQPHPELSRLTLTPPEDPVVHPPLEITPALTIPPTSEFQPVSLFNSEFDGLPSPVMDFCDLFIT